MVANTMKVDSASDEIVTLRERLATAQSLAQSWQDTAMKCEVTWRQHYNALANLRHEAEQQLETAKQEKVRLVAEFREVVDNYVREVAMLQTETVAAKPKTDPPHWAWDAECCLECEGCLNDEPHGPCLQAAACIKCHAKYNNVAEAALKFENEIDKEWSYSVTGSDACDAGEELLLRLAVCGYGDDLLVKRVQVGELAGYLEKEANDGKLCSKN